MKFLVVTPGGTPKMIYSGKFRVYQPEGSTSFSVSMEDFFYLASSALVDSGSYSLYGNKSQSFFSDGGGKMTVYYQSTQGWKKLKSWEGSRLEVPYVGGTITLVLEEE